MAKVFIEETTLTAIGDAIRGKTGKTDLIDPANMGTEIEGIQSGSDPIIESLEITSNGTYTATDCDGYSPITVNVPQDGGPPEEAFIITGDCSYKFSYSGWDWFIDTYGDKVSTVDINNMSYMFRSSNLEKIPFVLNVRPGTTSITWCFGGCNKLKESPKIRGQLGMNTSLDLGSMLAGCNSLRYAEDLFEPEMFDEFNTIKVTATYTSPKLQSLFENCHSLRQVPSWWYKFKFNPESTTYPSYTVYNYFLYSCYAIDEALNMPVWKCQAAMTTNNLSGMFVQTNRLKNITFETDNGQPIVTEWKSQTIDLTRQVGHSSIRSYITDTNSGITLDKEVKDDATYQALKNDPDWFTLKTEYSRYNYESAVNTINSLPDTSAYLASAGGTNTIKFKKNSGINTDGGGITADTMVEASAIAAAKGWTVSIA